MIWCIFLSRSRDIYGLGLAPLELFGIIVVTVFHFFLGQQQWKHVCLAR